MTRQELDVWLTEINGCTVALDGTVDGEKIRFLVDMSFVLTQGRG